MDADLASRRSPIYDMVSDQEFAKIFKANGFVQRALLDQDFLKLVVDPDFALLINDQKAIKILGDADLASRLIEMGLMNRRQK